MNIEAFCKKYNLGNIINITKLTGGLMHKMYKVETDKNTYCIKILNKEVMSRKDSYNNFILSEKISNIAKENNLPVSSAISIENNYINKLDNNYYMVFDYIDGKTLKDNEMTLSDCKQIGAFLGKLHSIDYTKLNIEDQEELCTYQIDFNYYINNKNFNNMKYKDIYLNNYQRYITILKRCVTSLNKINNKKSLCHRDMDPKNIMKDKNNNLIIIDWEAASLNNPLIELIETSLSLSGLQNDNFNEEKFKTIISEYIKYNKIEHHRYDTICANLVDKFKWLEYNLKRSLRIITEDEEEILIGENEVLKTINEINIYIESINNIYNILCNLTKKENTKYDEYVTKIINNTSFIKSSNFNKINSGFTNSIYNIDNYIIRICTDISNEPLFKNEIEFYKKYSNNTNIPKLYYSDITKKIIPYYYEIIEKIEGKTLYELWYKIDNNNKNKIIKQLIEIIKPFHKEIKESFNFSKYLKEYINNINNKCYLDKSLYNKLINICEKYFKENIFGVIHNDLHFDNIIYNENKLTILDFERSKIFPIDYDFRILSTCRYMPWLWSSEKTDILAIEIDYNNIIDMILNNYKELNNIPNIRIRLDFYAILELLNNYKNTKNEEILNIVNKILENIMEE